MVNVSICYCGSVLLGFAKKFGEVYKGAVVDGDWNDDPYHIAPHEDKPEVLQLQVAVESGRPRPVLLLKKMGWG